MYVIPEVHADLVAFDFEYFVLLSRTLSGFVLTDSLKPLLGKE